MFSMFGIAQVMSCLVKKFPRGGMLFFYRKEAKKGVEGYLIVRFLVFVEGEELEKHSKAKICLIKLLSPFFLATYCCGLGGI